MTIKFYISIFTIIFFSLFSLIACQQKPRTTKEETGPLSGKNLMVEESTKEIRQEVTNELTGVENKSKGVSEVISNKTAVVDLIQEKDIILNPDFKDGFDNWIVKEQGNSEISLIKTNDRNIVKISGKGGWSTISQKINVEEGKSYKFIVDAKCDNWSKDLGIIFAYSDVDKNVNYIVFPNIQTTNCWSESSKVLNCKKSGEASALIQYKNNGDIGTIYIRQIRAIELSGRKL